MLKVRNKSTSNFCLIWRKQKTQNNIIKTVTKSHAAGKDSWLTAETLVLVLCNSETVFFSLSWPSMFSCRTNPPALGTKVWASFSVVRSCWLLPLYILVGLYLSIARNECHNHNFPATDPASLTTNSLTSSKNVSCANLRWWINFREMLSQFCIQLAWIKHVP